MFNAVDDFALVFCKGRLLLCSGFRDFGRGRRVGRGRCRRTRHRGRRSLSRVARGRRDYVVGDDIGQSVRALGQNLDGYSGSLWLEGITVAIVGVEHSLASPSTSASAALCVGKYACGRRQVMVREMLMRVRTLSAPRGTGDRGHWEMSRGLAWFLCWLLWLRRLCLAMGAARC